MGFLVDENHRWINLILPEKLGKDILDWADSRGIKGDNVAAVSGTRNENVLKFLGISQSQSQWLLLTASEELETEIYDRFCMECLSNPSSHGIAFTIPFIVNSELIKEKGIEFSNEENVNYLALFIIVSSGNGAKVMEMAQLQGAKGGSIINNRVSGEHEKLNYFNIELNPDKEIVLIIDKKDRIHEIYNYLENEYYGSKLSAGKMFSVPVTRTAGIRE